jgi:hypothetical protein
LTLPVFLLVPQYLVDGHLSLENIAKIIVCVLFWEGHPLVKPDN